MAMPPRMVMEKLEKIEAELTPIHAMLQQLTGAWKGVEHIFARGLEHIFAPWGTTIGTAKGEEAKTQANME